MADLNNEKTSPKIIQNLERLYKTAIEEDKPFAFYKALEAYIEVVLKEPILKKVVDEQIKERNDIYEKINEIEIKAQKEMRLAKDKLLSFIKKHSIDTASFFRLNTFSSPPLTDIVLELEAYEKRQIKERFESKTLGSFLFDISANLLKLGHKEAVKDFIVSDTEYSSYYDKINGTGGYFLRNENGNFIFSPIWPERFVQENLLENGRVFKSWGAFELLLQFNCAFNLVARNVNFWSLSEDTIPEPLRRVEDFTDVALMVEDLYFLGGQTHPNSPRKFMSPHRSNELDRLNNPLFKSTLKMVNNILVQTIDDIIKPIAESPSVEPTIFVKNLDPKLKVESSGKGKKLFIQLHKKTKWIPIGLLSSDKVKVFLHLYNFEGNFNSSYESIRIIITGLYDKTIKGNILALNKTDQEKEKIQKIVYKIKEIQRIKDLRGFIEFSWQPSAKNPRSVQMLIRKK